MSLLFHVADTCGHVAQVEDYLKEVTKTDGPEGEIEVDAGVSVEPDPASISDTQTSFPDFHFGSASGSLDPDVPTDFGPIPDLPDMPDLASAGLDDDTSFLNDTQLMGLGLSESLPPMEMMEELYVIRLSCLP